MKKGIQRRKKEKIVAGVLEQSQDCFLKKAIERALRKSSLRSLKPFIIVNAKKMPSEIVDALEKEYYLVDKSAKKPQKP